MLRCRALGVHEPEPTVLAVNVTHRRKYWSRRAPIDSRVHARGEKRGFCTTSLVDTLRKAQLCVADYEISSFPGRV